MPNLIARYEHTYRKIRPLALRLSGSLKVIESGMVQSATYDFLLAIRI